MTTKWTQAGSVAAVHAPFGNCKALCAPVESPYGPICGSCGLDLEGVDRWPTAKPDYRQILTWESRQRLRNCGLN